MKYFRKITNIILFFLLIVFSSVSAQCSDLYSAQNINRENLAPSLYIQARDIQALFAVYEQPGILDGMTILRFSSYYDLTGGTEVHIQNLNAALLRRNDMKIIQMYITVREDNEDIQQIKIGRGTLVKAPVLSWLKTRGIETVQASSAGGMLYSMGKKVLKKLKVTDILKYWLQTTRFMPILTRLPMSGQFYHETGRTSNYTGVKEKIQQVLDSQQVDFVMIHTIGASESGIIIEAAKARGIPVLVQNHLDNTVFNDVAARSRLKNVTAVGGVSQRNVPSFLQAVFSYLGNGIDTKFFSRDASGIIPKKFDKPVVFLPGRIDPNKGHLDLVEIAYDLHIEGIDVKVVFAGRADNLDFCEEIKSLAKKYGIADNVIFAGELTQKELRDYYFSSDVVVLPSQSEGIPRVLLEAQAMEVPVIAYDVGGVSDAIGSGKTGYIVPVNNKGLFARSLKRVLQDNDLSTEMGKAGKDFVENNFSLSALASRHEKFYITKHAVSINRWLQQSL
ncbi:MAG: glycosyltransferase family 4 protein [Candidatus Omnitrophica bacterium]|nr:glycosyltransferase family 4 protein [Candidatus Omnitrophota bacterium]